MSNLGRESMSRRAFTTGLATGAAAGVTAGALSTWGIPRLFSEDTSLEEHEEPLRILSGEDVSSSGQRRRLVQQWNRANPNHPAEIVELSGVADKQLSSMRVKARKDEERAERGESGKYDILNLDVIWIAEFAERGHIRPLDVSRLETRGLLEGFLDAPLDTCRYEGELWALPFNTDAGLLFYRSDLVSRPPQSWNDIIDESNRSLSSQRIRAHNPTLEAGYVGQLANYEGLTVNALEAIWGAGGQVVNDEGRVEVNSKQAEQGLDRLWRGLHTDGKLILNDSLSYTEGDSLRAFMDGRVLFMRHWPQAYQDLQTQGDARSVRGRPASNAAGWFDVTRLPYPSSFAPSVLGGQNLAVSAYSAKPRAAQALIEFLTSPRSEQILLEQGGLPATRKIVYWDLMARMQKDSRLHKQYGYITSLFKTLDAGAQSRPKRRHYNHFSQVFAGEVHAALRNKNTDPDDEWLEQLREKLKLALAGKHVPVS